MNKLIKKEILNIKDEEKILEYLFDKVFNLGKEIIKIKKIQHDIFPNGNKELELYRMEQDIYYNSIWFESYRTLSNQVRFRYEDDILDEKVEFIVKVYNELLDELFEYQKQKERIEKEGFKKIDKQIKDGLKEIFCKMLDYKNRKYDKNSSLVELIEELELCYADYKYLFDDTYTMLKAKFVYRSTERDDFWIIHADDVEYICNIEFTYKYFAENEDNYKNYNQYYEDITLKKGQTLKDLYEEEREKLRLLFIEMLEFIKIDIPNDKNYNNLELLVRKYYPFYYDCFVVMYGTASYSYIDSIHYLRSNYAYFKRTYQNHKKMFIDYVKDEEKDIEEAKYNDEMLYDPIIIESLNELKSQFSDYFKDEDK